jgi:hypothetical protein
MEPENTQNTAPPPAAPPAHYIDSDLIPEHAMERIEHLLSQEQKDTLDKARIAGRDAKRAAAAKEKLESDASTKRAADVVKGVVEEQEEEQLQPGGPPVELELTPLLTADQAKIAEGYRQDMGVIAGEIGMPAEEAQTLLDFAIGGAVQTLEGLDTGNRAECERHLRNLYGDVYADSIIEGARSAFAKLPAGMQRWLDQTTSDGQVLGNHPSVLFALMLWHGGYTRMTPAAAARELAQHRASKEYLAGDRFKLEKVRLLGQIAARGQSNELPMPPKAAPVAQSQIQKRIDAIRRDPHYMGEARLRAALVAEMGDLYRQLHPETGA